MLASSYSFGRLYPLCLCVSLRCGDGLGGWHKVFTKKIWCIRCMHFGGFVEKARESIDRPPDQNGMPRTRYDCIQSSTHQWGEGKGSHEGALNRASVHPHKGTHRTQRNHPCILSKLLSLHQAPKQTACLPAAAALEGCVLCVCVSQ